MNMPIAESQIERARTSIDPVFLDSPVVRQSALDTALNCVLTLKIETLNPIRSFKGRGTEALMASLGGMQSRVVATSSGNFGQGLARAATKRGVGATIFSEEDANPVKLEAMRRLGAEVRMVARGEDDKAVARTAAAEMGACFIEDGAHAEIAAGAGTIAMELSAQCDRLDVIVVQIGDGALVTGVGSWIKATSPTTRVVGVTATGAPAMLASIRAKRQVSKSTDTVADGMAIRTPIASALHEVAAVVDEIVEVGDEAMLDAVALLLGAGIVAEPSGAAGVAAIMSHKHLFEGRDVAAIITGSNVHPQLLAEVARKLDTEPAARA